MEYSNVAQSVAEAISSKRGQDVVMVDVQEASTIASEFVVATANSDVHMGTLCNEAEDALDKLGVKYSREGQNSSMWRLIDAGDVLIHIFSSKGREFYNLDRIWGDRPVKRFENID
ncbi:ribosome silencing factor [Dethiosulfovibrio salsuginis]|uniref:Ribosomal silencing factor RsfS n=1 Tax=Dethiosulfovibrio salsuginis TaxID=561720 RepID=A0A1X7I2U7_9BACT|nr:ribosome silencing factor [Dethiosulfovibrio salsuginis]SMG08667.1 ribosome-associated protein [Dethiosulfovibrio salsuginis]